MLKNTFSVLRAIMLKVKSHTFHVLFAQLIQNGQNAAALKEETFNQPTVSQHLRLSV